MTMPELFNLKRRVIQYKEVLKNTTTYREAWKEHLKANIIKQLETLIEATGLEATVSVREDMDNLQAVVLSLGDIESGILQQVGASKIPRSLIKHNGSLIYQQLFNGKVVVLIQYPMIEGYGEPQPPKSIAIYRPEELTEPFFVRHMEDFMKEVTNWEDYDDDDKPAKQIGFNLNLKK